DLSPDRSAALCARPANTHGAPVQFMGAAAPAYLCAAARPAADIRSTTGASHAGRCTGSRGWGDAPVSSSSRNRRNSMNHPSAREVVLASNNAGKLREFSAILEAAGIQMIAQGALGVPEADEPHVTFVENALAKARHASQHTGRPALADDSGLCVPALNGAPGVYSARYASMNGGEKSDR